MVAREAFAGTGAQVQTAMAHLRGIGGIHQNHAHPCHECLVRQKFPQLVKGPIIGTPPLRLVSGFLVNPFSDARQVFQGNGRLSAGCHLDDSLADRVVQPTLEASLPARQPCQKLTATPPGAPGAFRSLLLENSPQLGKVITKCGHLIAAKALTVTGHGDVGTSQVNPDHVIRIIRRLGLGFDLDLEVIGAIVAFDQRGARRGLIFEQTKLVVADQQRDIPGPSGKQGQANRQVPLPKGEDSGVIADAGRFKHLDFRFRGLGRFPVRGDPPDRLDRQVCRQSEPEPHLRIKQGLKGNFVVQAVRCF